MTSIWRCLWYSANKLALQTCSFQCSEVTEHFRTENSRWVCKLWSNEALFGLKYYMEICVLNNFLLRLQTYSAGQRQKKLRLIQRHGCRLDIRVSVFKHNSWCGFPFSKGHQLFLSQFAAPQIKTRQLKQAHECRIRKTTAFYVHISKRETVVVIMLDPR